MPRATVYGPTGPTGLPRACPCRWHLLRRATAIPFSVPAGGGRSKGTYCRCCTSSTSVASHGQGASAGVGPGEESRREGERSSAGEPSRAATGTQGVPPSLPPVRTEMVFHEECRAVAEARQGCRGLQQRPTPPPPPSPPSFSLSCAGGDPHVLEGGGGWAGEAWMASVACDDHDRSRRAAGSSHLCRRGVKGAARRAPRMAVRTGHPGGCAPWRRRQLGAIQRVPVGATPAVVSHPAASRGGMRF